MPLALSNQSPWHLAAGVDAAVWHFELEHPQAVEAGPGLGLGIARALAAVGPAAKARAEVDGNEPDVVRYEEYSGTYAVAVEECEQLHERERQELAMWLAQGVWVYAPWEAARARRRPIHGWRRSVGDDYMWVVVEMAGR
jgi:hypothetical protein